MSGENIEFPYKKFALVFTALNALFLFIAVAPNFLFPEEFGALGTDFNNDPADSAPLAVFLGAIISALVCLIFKRKRPP